MVIADQRQVQRETAGGFRALVALHPEGRLDPPTGELLPNPPLDLALQRKKHPRQAQRDLQKAVVDGLHLDHELPVRKDGLRLAITGHTLNHQNSSSKNSPSESETEASPPCSP